MSLTLILVRHAKSSWADPDQSDFDRPLNERGRRSAALIGDWLAEHAPMPRQALVSSALRAAETWERIEARLGSGADLTLTRGLYHAGPGEIREVLQTAAAPVVILIGHNPGLADLAAGLVRSAPDHPRFADYPTGATLVARFTAPRWSEIGQHSGEALDFVTPRELE